MHTYAIIDFIHNLTREEYVTRPTIQVPKKLH